MSGGVKQRRAFEIDGKRFSTINGFYNEIERVLIPDMEWGRNLDAFNDILAGGFGTPEHGFVLIWRNAETSRRTLGKDKFGALISIIRGYGADTEFAPYRIDLELK